MEIPNLADRRTFLQQLSKSSGWIVLKDEINKQFNAKMKRIRACPDYELDKLQGYLNGLEFVLKKVEDSNKGENENAINT